MVSALPSSQEGRKPKTSVSADLRQLRRGAHLRVGAAGGGRELAAVAPTGREDPRPGRLVHQRCGGGRCRVGGDRDRRGHIRGAAAAPAVPGGWAGEGCATDGG